MTSITPISTADNSKLAVLNEQIYGYKHGIRPLALQTTAMENKDLFESRLKRDNLNYYMLPSPDKKNVSAIFGDKPCVDVVKSFDGTPLYKLTPEKDFILGILLGYDKTKQCERYLKLKNKETENKNLNVVA